MRAVEVRGGLVTVGFGQVCVFKARPLYCLEQAGYAGCFAPCKAPLGLTR